MFRTADQFDMSVDARYNGISGHKKLKNKASTSMKQREEVDGRNQGSRDHMNTVTTTNVVKVDYIEGEYADRDDDGFAKRMPQGYSRDRRYRSIDDAVGYGDDGSDQMGNGLVNGSGG